MNERAHESAGLLGRLFADAAIGAMTRPFSPAFDQRQAFTKVCNPPCWVLEAHLRSVGSLTSAMAATVAIART